MLLKDGIINKKIGTITTPRYFRSQNRFGPESILSITTKMDYESRLTLSICAS